MAVGALQATADFHRRQRGADRAHRLIHGTQHVIVGVSVRVLVYSSAHLPLVRTSVILGDGMLLVGAPLVEIPLQKGAAGLVIVTL